MEVLKVDYRDPNAPKRFVESLRNTGFAVLTNHPVPQNLIFDTYSEWERFFNSEEKQKFTYTKERQDGYFPFRSENAKDYSVKDLKEFYHVYASSKLPGSFSEKSWTMYDRMSELAAELLGWVEDNTPEKIRQTFSMPLREMVQKSPKTLLRVIHYPPQADGLVEEGAIRAAAHEDINLITLLPSATAPGLQVQDMEGNWHDVPCDPGSIAINAGDMLQMASDGYYRSTTHRVVNPPEDKKATSRYSMPLFLHPWPEVKLSRNHTADSYLNERLRELGLK